LLYNLIYLAIAFAWQLLGDNIKYFIRLFLQNKRFAFQSFGSLVPVLY